MFVINFTLKDFGAVEDSHGLINTSSRWAPCHLFSIPDHDDIGRGRAVRDDEFVVARPVEGKYVIRLKVGQLFRLAAVDGLAPDVGNTVLA